MPKPLLRIPSRRAKPPCRLCSFCASRLVVAAMLAGRDGLIPPDFGGIYGPGETLTYAAQRLLTLGT